MLGSFGHGSYLIGHSSPLWLAFPQTTAPLLLYPDKEQKQHWQPGSAGIWLFGTVASPSQ